jgi:hypothetical protein
MSLPASGSEKPWQKMTSPDRIRGRYHAFCSGVPHAMMVGPTMPRPITPMCSEASRAAVSSRKMAW